ncbi:hypothetical protein GF366_00410 [Candidatus Peregrinibacteria bacterium]|nr:hypothetical protein [Candidatus Peregrinibacteria bacterium]
MKNISKAVITTVIASLLTSFAFTASATYLTDIDEHKNETAILFLNNLNIIHGHPDGTFKPDTGINRAEILKILFEASNQPLTEPTAQCFPDVPLNDWYTTYVCSAKELGLAHGYPDGTFKPANNVNKAEAVKLIAMFAEWNLDEALDEELFEDTDENAWYAPYLKFAKKKELIEYKDNVYRPEDDMTRGEVAETVFRSALVKYLGTEKYQESDIQTYLTDFYETTELTPPPEFGIEPAETTPDTEPAPTSCTNSSDALDVILSNIVEPHPNRDMIATYQYGDTLKNDDYFGYFDNNSEGQIVIPDEEVWFYWIDLYPNQAFFHDNKIATVDMECNLAEYDSQLYPIINGNAIYKTDEERATTPDLVDKGEKYEDLLKEILEELTKDDPRFGTCGADPEEAKRAFVLYLGDDVFIKRNAVNMYNYLCNNNYVTTVVTGNNAATVLANIEAELRKIETESHDTGFKNVHFHVSSHGKKGTGDLFVTEVAEITTDPLTIELKGDYVDLDDLASKFGEIAFTIGKEGIWSDSFTIIHDTCYSGNAIPKYQAEAYIPDVRETAVGHLASSAPSDKPSYATSLAGIGHMFTNAITTCTASTEGYDSFEECVLAEAKDLFLFGPPEDFPTPVFEKLSPITDESVPFFP